MSSHFEIDYCCVGVGTTGCQPLKFRWSGLAASEMCAMKCLLRTYIVINVNRFGQIDGRVILQC